MNLLQLRYFYDTVGNQSLAKTAEKYSVPASSVSASIKRLEEELGVKLFDRTANRIVLNPAGKALAYEVKDILERLDGVVHKFSEPEKQITQIKILAKARPKWIAELVIEYMKTHPNIKFIVSNDYSATNLEDYDFVIDESALAYEGWQNFLLSVEILCIKAGVNHRLAGQELSFAQIKDEAFILPSKGNGMRRLYEKLCKMYDFAPNVCIECNDRQLLQYYVQSGMGLTIGANRALTDNTQNAIVPLKVTDFNEIQQVYVFFRKAYDNSARKEFKEFLYSKRFNIDGI